jgi:hypothetical protein
MMYLIIFVLRIVVCADIVFLICSRRQYMFGDDSDDDEKRVVRSQKDKR